MYLGAGYGHVKHYLILVELTVARYDDFLPFLFNWADKVVLIT